MNKFITCLKGKLGLCQSPKCYKKATMVIKIKPIKVTRMMCDGHTRNILDLTEPKLVSAELKDGTKIKFE